MPAPEEAQFQKTGLEWSETNGWVSAEQLRVAPPLGHLQAYLLASNFLFRDS
jgi:hypothetical protein